MIKIFLQRLLQDPKRRQQLLLYGLGGSLGMLGFAGLMWVSEKAPSKSQDEEKKEHYQIQAPMEAVDQREAWVSRVETTSRKTQEKLVQQEAENKLLQERLLLLEQVIHGSQTQGKPSGSEASSPQQPASPQGTVLQKISPTSFPSQLGEDEMNTFSIPSPKSDTVFKENAQPRKKWREISLQEADVRALRHVDYYIPKGTYAKAVLLSGAVASTATNAQSNPLPLVLRLVDEGNLPRGWKSTVKDAVLIGSCYGDLSSERVLCRLESMSWVEEDGKTIERDVEGWIIGEDGRPGLRGKVVDRSSDVAQQTLVAGILSGMAQLLQHSATSSVFPMTPFGQSNTLSTRDVVKGSVGTGASSALERLADFAIKRAESMSPVLMINSGRVVDVVFRKGIYLRGNPQDYRVVGQATTTPVSSPAFFDGTL